MKRRHRGDDSPPEVTLPITPMLDMAFQLLFFFVATFQPPVEREGQIGLVALSTTAVAAKKPSDVANPESNREDVDDKADLTVAIRGHKDPDSKDTFGRLNGITVVSTSGSEEMSGQTAEDMLKSLRARLRKALQDKS